MVNKPGWQPLKLEQDNMITCCSIYGCDDRGPSFGDGADLEISNNATSNTESHSNLGNNYSLPPGYSSGSSFTQSFLAGSLYFRPDEVEVFYETT